MSFEKLGEVVGGAVKAHENSSLEPSTDGLDIALAGFADPTNVEALRGFQRCLEVAGFWPTGVDRIGEAIKRIQQAQPKSLEAQPKNLADALRKSGIPAPSENGGQAGGGTGGSRPPGGRRGGGGSQPR